MNGAGRHGIGLMVAAMAVFGAQDALSRHLAAEYGTIFILMIRFWFFAGFVLGMSALTTGGLRGVARTRHPFLQILRGVVLVLQLVLLIQGFVSIGLVESHAIFACYPLIVAALAVPFLGERVPRVRWLAIVFGLVGVIIILRPGATILSLAAVIVLAAASIFASYSILTRLVARHDRAETSFFYTGVTPAVLLTFAAPFVWRTVTLADWGWLALLCASGSFGHFLLIRAYQSAEANTLQPFAYLQLVTASTLGVLVFGETLTWTTIVGASIVVAAGLLNLWLTTRSASTSHLRVEPVKSHLR